MTYPGMPSVFYGDERGIKGIVEKDYRNPMIWDDISDELSDFYKTVIALRNNEEVLRHGKYEVGKVNKDDYLFIFRRFSDDKEINVYLNMSDADRRIDEGSDIGMVLLQEGLEDGILSPGGYAVIKK